MKNMFKNPWAKGGDLFPADILDGSEVLKNRLFDFTTNNSNANWHYNTIKSKFTSHSGEEILKLEFEAGKDGTSSKQRWKDLYGENTCAIRLSYALNNAGYIIPEHKTKNNRLTWNGNINSKHQYILSADEMGYYLGKKLGTPSIATSGPVTKDSEIDDLMKEFEKWSDYKGIIYLDSKNHKEYGATGHVDLIYEDWGNDPHILGSDQELDDYLDWRNGDGWFNDDAKIQVKVWFLEGKLK
jgi:hypothetical protein